MKKLSLLLAASAMVASSVYAADDIVSVAPQQYKVLKEDAKFRVIEATLKKGDKIPTHSHPAHVVYIIKAGKVKFTLADGTTTDSEPKDGDALIIPPVTHSHEHSTDGHVIIVETKQ